MLFGNVRSKDLHLPPLSVLLFMVASSVFSILFMLAHRCIFNLQATDERIPLGMLSCADK